MNINPGKLDKRIEIIRFRRPDPETNENGFPLPSVEEVVRRPWARVTHKSGSEIIAANSEFATAKQRFLIRYSDADIDTDCIIRYGGKDYDIEYINDYNDSHEYLEIWTGTEERV